MQYPDLYSCQEGTKKKKSNLTSPLTLTDIEMKQTVGKEQTQSGRLDARLKANIFVLGLNQGATLLQQIW